MEEDYVVWGLEGMISTVSSRSEHLIAAANNADELYIMQKRSDLFIL